YTVSHDLKSPVITILGFLDLVKKDANTGETEKLDKDLQYIRTAANKMHELLDDLLELSRVGRVVNPSIEIDFSALIEDTLTLLNQAITSRNVVIQTQNIDIKIYGDRTRLLEVLQNLIENALKFMGDQPEPAIEIGTLLGANQVICYVKDNGVGIESKYCNKIFDLFERLDHSSEGTGVGLALVKRIIEFHQGEIWVESNGENQGCSFYFSLPHRASGEAKEAPI
ncbi:MAG: HAMP domain-containing sensor histidine kinase, partial [Pseudomonadota bacterium]